jgi:hypothetical protein
MFSARVFSSSQGIALLPGVEDVEYDSQHGQQQAK